MSCGRKINLKIQGKKSKIQVKKSKTRKHRGGSYASDLVMKAANSSPVMDDYVTNPRIRNGPNADFIGLDNSTRKQNGGSAASDMTMENLNDIAKTNKYAEGWQVKGDMNSLNTYQPSGGNRKYKNHKSKNHKSKSHKFKSHKSKNLKSKNRKSKNQRSNKHNNKSKRSNRNKNSNHNNHRVAKGGASDYMASYYSLNENVARPNIAWDPPTRDLAGSGAPMSMLEGANVTQLGSPLV
jgi:hypothetical protein